MFKLEKNNTLTIVEEDKMSWSDFWVGVAAVLVVFALVGGCTLWTQGIERNSRVTNNNGTKIKVACIQAGKILVHNDCIPAGK